MPIQSSAEFAVNRVVIRGELHEKGQLSFSVAQKGAVFRISADILSLWMYRRAKILVDGIRCGWKPHLPRLGEHGESIPDTESAFAG